MGEWKTIRLTEAAQVHALLDDEARAQPDDELALRAYYDEAKATDSMFALDIIGHALPRREVIAWAAGLLDSGARERPLGPRNQQALDCVLRWLGDPEDEYRRAAFEAAEQASSDSPARLLGMAVFMSGGSLSPEDAPPVLPDPVTCNRLAIAAVKAEAYRGEDADAFVAHALDAAEAAAEGDEQSLRSAR